MITCMACPNDAKFHIKLYLSDRSIGPQLQVRALCSSALGLIFCSDAFSQHNRNLTESFRSSQLHHTWCALLLDMRVQRCFRDFMFHPRSWLQCWCHSKFKPHSKHEESTSCPWSKLSLQLRMGSFSQTRARRSGSEMIVQDREVKICP